MQNCLDNVQGFVDTQYYITEAAMVDKISSKSNFSEKTTVDYDEKFAELKKAEYIDHQSVDFDSGFSVVPSFKESHENFENDIVRIDKSDEKKLVKKLDLHILPLFCLFYFADFLDRANIGNAT